MIRNIIQILLWISLGVGFWQLRKFSKHLLEKEKSLKQLESNIEKSILLFKGDENDTEDSVQ